MQRANASRTRDEAYLKHVAVRRWGRVGMYALLCAAGIVSVFYPSILISAHVGRSSAVILSGGMAIGGLVALLGSLTDRWIFEYSILPLLIISLACYGVGACLTAKDLHNWPVLAYGLTLLAFGSGLIARWQDVKGIVKVRRAEIGYLQSKGW